MDLGEWGAYLEKRYERVRVVGQGASGTAWLVRSRSDGEEYIAKEVSLDMMSEVEREAARNEVRVLASIRHPHVVRYTDHHEDEARLVIVTEYCAGGDLERLIEQFQSRPMPEDVVVDVVLQLCSALEHIHSRNILHRDLKAANVFRTADGEVKLGDFGISKTLQHTGQHAVTLCGTPFYFSPELCNGEPYDQKSDVWALGVLMYQLLAGRKPFEAANILALINQVLSEQPAPLPARCSAAAVDMVGRLLCKDPGGRPGAKALLSHPLLSSRGAVLRDRDPNAERRPQQRRQSPEEQAKQQWLDNRRAAAANKRRCQQEQAILGADPAPPARRARPRREEVPVACPVVVERTAVPIQPEELRRCGDGSWDSDQQQQQQQQKQQQQQQQQQPPPPLRRGADGSRPDPAAGSWDSAPDAQPLRRAADGEDRRPAADAADDRALRRVGSGPDLRGPADAPAVHAELYREQRREAARNRERLRAAVQEMEREAECIRAPPPAPPPAEPFDPASSFVAVSPAVPARKAASDESKYLPPPSPTAGSPPSPAARLGDAAASPAAQLPGALASTPEAPRPEPDTEVTRWLDGGGITGPGGGTAEFALTLAAEGVHTLPDLRSLVRQPDEFKRIVPGWGYRHRISEALGLSDSDALPLACESAAVDVGQRFSADETPRGSTPEHSSVSDAAPLRRPGRLAGSPRRERPRSGCCVAM